MHEPLQKYLSAARLSRRNLLTGVAGLAGLAVAGSLAGCDLPGQQPAASGATPGLTSTPTSVAQGTTLLVYNGHNDIVNDVMWSPDGKRIASASGYPFSGNPDIDNAVHLWDPVTGTTSLVYKDHPSGIIALGWSPDSQLVVSLEQRTVTVWEASTGRQRVSFTPDSADSWVTGIAWSPDGTRIAVAGYLDVQIWDAVNGQLLPVYPLSLPPNQSQQSMAVAWSPDSKLIASAALKAGHSVQIWGTKAGEPFNYYPGGSPTALSWSPDGKYLALQDTGAQVTVWEAIVNGRMIFSRATTPPLDAQVVLDMARPHAVAWSSDSAHLAFAGFDKQAQVWNVITGQHTLTYQEHTGTIWALTWSPDGKRVASGSKDKTVRVWQAL